MKKYNLENKKDINKLAEETMDKHESEEERIVENYTCGKCGKKADEATMNKRHQIICPKCGDARHILWKFK